MNVLNLIMIYSAFIYEYCLDVFMNSVSLCLVIVSIVAFCFLSFPLSLSSLVSILSFLYVFAFIYVAYRLLSHVSCDYRGSSGTG